MGLRMKIEAVCFCGAVITAVWSTRSIYYDGLRQQFVRLKRHCVMQAAMIVGISTWAVAVGFNFQSTIVSKERTIEQLTAGRNVERFTDQIADAVVGKSFEVTTPNGASLTWAADKGHTNRPVLRAAERIRSGSGGIGSGDSDIADSGGSLGSLRGIAESSGHVF